MAAGIRNLVFSTTITGYVRSASDVLKAATCVGRVAAGGNNRNHPKLRIYPVENNSSIYLKHSSITYQKGLKNSFSPSRSVGAPQFHCRGLFKVSKQMSITLFCCTKLRQKFFLTFVLPYRLQGKLVMIKPFHLQMNGKTHLTLMQ